VCPARIRNEQSLSIYRPNAKPERRTPRSFHLPVLSNGGKLTAKLSSQLCAAPSREHSWQNTWGTSRHPAAVQSTVENRSRNRRHAGLPNPRCLSRARPPPSERVFIALCRDAFELVVAPFCESRFGIRSRVVEVYGRIPLLFSAKRLGLGCGCQVSGQTCVH